jgi:hypothetical protein
MFGQGRIVDRRVFHSSCRCRCRLAMRNPLQKGKNIARKLEGLSDQTLCIEPMKTYKSHFLCTGSVCADQSYDLHLLRQQRAQVPIHIVSNFGYLPLIPNDGPYRASFHVRRCMSRRWSDLWSRSTIYSSAFTLSHNDSSLIKQLGCIDHRRCGSWTVGNQD